MNSLLLLQQASPEISIWGIVIPGAVFAVSFVTTLMLYRHFSKPQ